MSGGNFFLDPVTVTINGQVYGGWTEVVTRRSIEHMASSFDLAVTNRWSLDQAPWPIQPYDACTISIAGDLWLTGSVDSYVPQLTGTHLGVRIAGRSKTADLVDCCPDVPSGQYSGYSLGQIARAICGLFGVAVVEQTDTSNTFADATIERGETAWKFLERLCRLSGVLATDDERGRLVLTAAGTTRNATALQQGVNMLTAHAVLSGAHRFSDYVIKGQAGLALSWAGAGGSGTPGAAVATDLRAVATDPGVPRYRPHVAIAESQLDQPAMQERANWMARFQAGKATQLHVGVKGFRDQAGALWRINQLVACTSAFCGVDQDLLLAGVELRKDNERGSRTELTFGPPDAYAPDPGQVKRHKVKGSGADWNGAGGVSKGPSTQAPPAQVS